MSVEYYCQVSTTIDSRPAAMDLAGRLVSGRLAACVQISGPITSVYRWHGEIEQAEEWLVTAKTTRDRYSDVERAIRAGHPYEVPEILCVPVLTGGADYLAWIAAETGSGSGSGIGSGSGVGEAPPGPGAS